jgi:hypothetical protein
MEAVLSLPRKLNTNVKSCLALFACACVLVVTTGCSSLEVKNAVQDIANAIPQVQPYITSAQAIIDTLDPAAAPIVNAGVALVQTGLATLTLALNAYTASPSTTAWGAVVDAVTTLVTENSATILTATHIIDPVSRKEALIVMTALQTALLLIVSIVQRVHDAVTSSKLTAAANATPVKLSQLKDYLNHEQIESATGVPFTVAYNYEVSQGF